MAEKTQIVITAKDETGIAFASAKRNLDSLKTAGSSLASTFATLGVGGGIIGLIGGAGALSVVKQSIDELDALNLSAERLGVSASKLDTFNFAGKLAGLADDDIEKALAKISVKLEEAAAGSKTAIGWFDKLGVSWLDASGKVKTADKAFEDVADRISEMQDGTGKVTTLVEGFGDKLGRKLAPALNEGAKGFKALREELEQLAGGKANLDTLAKQADEFNDNLDKLAFFSKAASRNLVTDMIPALVDYSAQVLIAIRNSDGLLDAFMKYGVMKSFNFKTPTESLAALNKEAQSLEDRISIGRGKDGDADKLRGLQQQISYYNELDKLKNKPEAPQKPKATTGGSSDAPPKPAKTGGGARSAADDAARLIAQLNEQIALKGVDAESTDKLTAAEQQRAKVLYQLDAGTLKASAAQREKITSALDELVVLDRTLQAQKEYTAAVDKQEQANLKSRDAMLEQIAAAEKSAELYGLNATQINAVTQSRLEEAIALASINGAMPEHIAFMEAELSLQKQLGAALENNDLAGLLSQTETARKAKTEAQTALLDRALASGNISAKQYQEALDALKGSVNEMDQFAIQAARNIQDAFAEFLFDPFGKSADDMLKNFGQTLQKMLSQAASAQALNLFVGDIGKTGKIADDSLIGGLLKKAGSFDWAGLFGFANGGIMTGAGPLPLNKYAMGGIANSPQLAMFGEGRTPEAYVPLPDGRSIPVTMRGGGGGAISLTQHFHGPADARTVKRAGAAALREVSAISGNAVRYV
jgi:hypothetical protein